MATFPGYRHDRTGKTMYVVLNNQAGQYWDDVAAAYETFVPADWGNYDITSTETPAASYQYIATVPATLTSDASVCVTLYEQVAGAPAIDDIVVASATFWWNGTIISTMPANVTQIDGELTNGNNATLKLKELNIDNDSGTAFSAIGSTVGALIVGSGGIGLNVSGSTTGMTIAGNTDGLALDGIAGTGLIATSYGGNGSGIIAVGNGSGHGLYINAGVTGDAVVFEASGGDALYLNAALSGIDIDADQIGIDIDAIVIGVDIDGGTFGMTINASNGDAVAFTSTGGDGDGLVVSGNGTGSGLAATGETGATITGGTGDGVAIFTNSGYGMHVRSVFSDGVFFEAGGFFGDGFICSGAGLGVDINASEINDILADTLALTSNRGEPGQLSPPVSADTNTKIDYLYKNWRNRKEQNSNLFKLYNDAETIIDQKSDISDAGGLFTKGEMESG